LSNLSVNSLSKDSLPGVQKTALNNLSVMRG